MTDRELLAVYLNDHLAGSAAGIRRVERLASILGGSPEGAALEELAAEITADRRMLLSVIDSVGARPSAVKQALARAAELGARVKPNGRWWRRSPLTPLTEIELLMLAVRGKLAGWQVLSAVLPPGQVPLDLEAMVRRSTGHYERMQDLHRRIAPQALRHG